MELKEIYKSSIERPINGVIKVAQNDEESLRQELQEYVVTKELRRHFSLFYNNYERSLETPTDKIGVWISGFFGSGKSHFLKILSYLLANNTVAGKKAVEYFADKFDDPMMFAQVERCASVPTDTILFNIDQKSPVNKDKTAILRVFAKVFYDFLGFYGNDLKVAKLEQFITKQGKMDSFKACFKDINGSDWEDSRDAFAFFEDDIVETLMQTLGMSETAARNWFNGTETAEISIDSLVNEISDYVMSRGRDYRLLFMVDEMGQYIGTDTDLMLNLQTIVEQIGINCYGQVWVIVTSQEKIDNMSIITGSDFSKIQGRFNTRISLSSSSVDEVIKKRLLQKTEHAEALLKMSYETNSAVLKNLFTFENQRKDLKGYAGADDYAETYPFVPYQFNLMQSVLEEIRKHNHAGQHQSLGERSMLALFQEAAKDIIHKDETALVPFSMFYNTVHTFLESVIRRVIDRCQTAADNFDGIEQYDVNVLKVLYLIRYIDDIPANIENITTLLIENINTDKIDMRQKVQESLDRLLKENYISRNGDIYTFLTDEEQDIDREIRAVPVDSANIVKAVGDRIFGDIYPSKKFRYDKNNDFAYDQMIDETTYGQITGAMKLRFVTLASDLYSGDDSRFIMMSGTNDKDIKEAIIVLSEEYPYYEELENAMQIRKFVSTRNVSNFPESIQNIIRNKQHQATALEKRAKEYIEKSIVNGRIYVAGEKITIKNNNAKELIDTVLGQLVESVYTKLYYINKNYSDDSEILKILSGNNGLIVLDGTEPNSDATDEVYSFLNIQHVKMLPTSMGDIQRKFSDKPFGWREIDIAAIVAGLIYDQKVSVQYGGTSVLTSDRHLVDFLRRKNEVDRTIISLRVVIPQALIKSSCEFLREFFNTMDIPTDEDGLITYVIDGFDVYKDELRAILNSYHPSYPGRDVIENGIKLCESLLSNRKDNVALLKKMKSMQDDFYDFAEDYADVEAFYKNQRTVFDKAVKTLDSLKNELDYLQAESEATACINKIKEIVTMKKPYSRISELPALIQKIESVYADMLSVKREEVYAEVTAAMGEIHQTAPIEKSAVVKKADDALSAKKAQAAACNNLTMLDAMKVQIQNIRQQYLKALVITEKPNVKTASVSRNTLCYAKKLKNEEDIDAYLADIKEHLLSLLKDKDELQIF